MREFGAELAGSSRVLRRAELLLQLKKLRGRAPFRHEEQRRARGGRAPPGAAHRKALEARLSGLLEGVTVEADQIEVRYGGAKEALVKLVALPQALNNHYERFEGLVGKGETSG